MDIAATVGILFVAFLASALVGYLATDRRRSKHTIQPEPGTTLRLRSMSGMYRSKLMEVSPTEWRISAPLSRNHYVPLRLDESLMVEAPVKNGVYMFRTVVCGRDSASHELCIQPPTNISPRDRREVKRYQRHEDAKIDGHPALLVDVSALGAKLKSSRHFRPGDRVSLDMPDGRVYAWILETWPTRHGDEWDELMRVRFETTLDSVS